MTLDMFYNMLPVSNVQFTDRDAGAGVNKASINIKLKFNLIG
jgi:hypothetical protein